MYRVLIFYKSEWKTKANHTNDKKDYTIWRVYIYSFSPLLFVWFCFYSTPLQTPPPLSLDFQFFNFELYTISGACSLLIWTEVFSRSHSTNIRIYSNIPHPCILAQSNQINLQVSFCCFAVKDQNQFYLVLNKILIFLKYWLKMEECRLDG